jgi:phosphoadenosine phosphosulfate reductase
MPGPVYLGKIQVNWCRECNLPILEDATCPCGARTLRVPLTPPGDAYPAVGKSLDTIRSTIDAAYGDGVGERLIPGDKLALLNNIPSQDRAIELVLDGWVLGRSFYDPVEARWTFKPTMEGARRLAALSDRRKVAADGGAVAAIMGSASLLAPGVLSADKAIQPGDEVTLQDPDGGTFGVGTARMTGPEMIESRRGVASKVRETAVPSQPAILPGGQKWEDAVRANERVLARREEEAMGFISQVAGSRGLPVCVAFSGGKDSLCTLLLAAKALEDFKILFVDTGIEFPETVKYTKDLIEKLGMKDRLIVREVGDRFWDAMKIFGPPSRDARWCCKVCKLGPTTSIIQEVFGGKCLTFVGQRRYESQQRLSRGRISRNPWVPGQLAASPIREWTALHVWLYAFREKAEMNPLYCSGYARIGCSVCPASEMAEIALLRETHPDIADRLKAEIGDHGRRNRMPDVWVTRGLWRWRHPPAWAGEEMRGPQDPFEYVERVRYRRIKAESGMVLSGSLGETDHERAANALKPLGDPDLTCERISTSASGIEIDLDPDGTVTLGPAENEKLIDDVGRRVSFCLVKAGYCVGCGTCVGSCHRGAIRIKDGKSWIGKNCTNCGSCIELCPLLTWAVKDPARPFA